MTPPGLEYRVRESDSAVFTFILNHNDTSVSVELTRELFDLFKNTQVKGNVLIGPHDLPLGARSWAGFIFLACPESLLRSTRLLLLRPKLRKHLAALPGIFCYYVTECLGTIRAPRGRLSAGGWHTHD